ncbi:MAG TPA: MgtC/SapB family protein [Xanthobacteraceae bacterium]|nr:MgtC/SapB family protein [Xanthobacteraceae bacterium]
MNLDIDILQRFLAAIAIGLLVGIERGWRERDAGAGQRTAGIRTFTLSGLLGGVFGAIAKSLEDVVGGGIVIAVGVFAYTAVFATFRFREVVDEDSYGVTTVVAAIATFALGVYAMVGDPILAAAIGVVVTIVLAVREPLHGWLTKITWLELRAGLVLVTMTLLALPLIPNESYGPFGGVNPREIWLLAVVLAAVSFAGYVAVKILGNSRGLLVASAAGGLVSSTAVTADLSRRAGKSRGNNDLLAAGITLASAVSYLRALVVVAALNPLVGIQAAAPIGAAILIALAVVFFYARRGMQSRSGVEFHLSNPFSIKDTFGLAILLGVVLFATEAIAEWLGPRGALVAAVVAGTATVDAAAFSMARLARDTITPAAAALGVMLAIGANNALKLVIGLTRAGRPCALALTLGLVLPVAAGLAVAAAMIGMADGL